MWRSRNESTTRRPSFATSIHNRHSNEHSKHIDREEDYEDSSFDLHQESCYDNSGDAMKGFQVNGLECNIYLNAPDISLEEFEERLCILEDLKALEAQLFALGDDEQQLPADIKPVENFMSTSVKKYDESYEILNPEENQSERKETGSTSKRLLPLLDATDTESVQGELNQVEIDNQPTWTNNSLFSGSELEQNELSIPEELHHKYQRLQALETDREFLKHYLFSINNGDKGMVLLKKFLQHIRDLKSVELCARRLEALQHDIILDYIRMTVYVSR